MICWFRCLTIHRFEDQFSRYLSKHLPGIGLPAAQWDAQHLAKDFFRALEGDIRVKGDTIIVTYYNAPNADRMRSHYENLPDKLAAEGIQPTLPWLYDYKLDFRFK